MGFTLQLLIGLVAMLHFYFMYLEMFAWTTKAKKIFRKFPKDLFEPTKVLAANQGLYNGFLAAGLVCSLFITDLEWQQNSALFFLSCVAIAGIYGGLSVSKKIFFIQGVPALVGVLMLLITIYSS
ncbi:Hypothetical protein I595_1443 [Croceitalea dokdonensis DOKDO 023]|uniref:Integral membrane protein n=1 Tax=Croceitalea dokdonensis DOKDO 023 TaxID=1300341 RepID=A0A0P7AXU4_9FLAO|nr:DUF1304 domain-containing protein [Croceitalea dokdonensis]KPM33016.1 Hypothetical protein I595_1443 [Croceitalea dokdonensis DOKDO 023]